MNRSAAGVLAAVVVIVCARDVRPAHACGGCFSPPEAITSVDSHRMVVSLAPTRSVLWDQIRYSGAPEDFVWVLPIPTPDAQIEVGDSLFFDELEAWTQVQVQSPPLPPGPVCPPVGDGPSGGLVDGGASAPDAGVEVFREEVVGPYEVAVIGSDSATALVDWLGAHGYAIPDAARPTIQFYVDRGDEFIALRLAPTAGVNAMQPVRVEYPGYMATFPLRMVTVGTTGKVALTLWVFAEQRYESKNYPAIEIDASDLVWDFSLARSNYRDLFRRSIDRAGGRAWVTQFAQPATTLSLSSPEVAVATAAVPNAFVTRLETDLLVDHLAEDLVLGPSAGDWVSNFVQAGQSVAAPPPPTCPEGGPDRWHSDRRGIVFGCASAPGGTLAGVAIAALGLAALALRRRRVTARRRT